jgi:hypothetical protein
MLNNFDKINKKSSISLPDYLKSSLEENLRQEWKILFFSRKKEFLNHLHLAIWA